MKPVKSFGMLVEGYRGVGRVITVVAKERMSRLGYPLGLGELNRLES
jgi:hypothetical protein